MSSSLLLRLPNYASFHFLIGSLHFLLSSGKKTGQASAHGANREPKSCYVVV
jgi:hypothetical protein